MRCPQVGGVLSAETCYIMGYLLLNASCGSALGWTNVRASALMRMTVCLPKWC